jgi:hypothetical protein
VSSRKQQQRSAAKRRHEAKRKAEQILAWYRKRREGVTREDLQYEVGLTAEETDAVYRYITEAERGYKEEVISEESGTFLWVPVTAAGVQAALLSAEKNNNPMRVKDTGAFCEAVAQAYDEAPLFDESEVWRWYMLRDSVDRMYDQVTQKIDVEFVEGQPYETAEEMREEVERTGVMYISTEGNEHPVFTPEENLRFRAVHDYIVHIIPGERGPDFSERGELRAYNLHRRLAPRASWPALFTEVAAQACYVNARGEFPVQKVAVLPGFDFYNVGWRTNEQQMAAKLKTRLLR